MTRIEREFILIEGTFVALILSTCTLLLEDYFFSCPASFPVFFFPFLFGESFFTIGCDANR